MNSKYDIQIIVPDHVNGAACITSRIVYTSYCIYSYMKNSVITRIMYFTLFPDTPGAADLRIYDNSDSDVQAINFYIRSRPFQEYKSLLCNN